MPLVVLDDRRVTYREVEEASADLARGLLAAGLGKGSRVGLLAPNGPEWIIGWLAAARLPRKEPARVLAEQFRKKFLRVVSSKGRPLALS